MRSAIGILWGLAVVSLSGCIGPDCTSEGFREESRQIPLRLVSSLDSFAIRYENPHFIVGKFPVREHRNAALGDTVVCRFFGLEGRYRENRMFNSVTVDSAGIRIIHKPIGADSVGYRDSSRTIQVLRKQACSPLDPGFHVDSVHLELGEGKRVVFTANQAGVSASVSLSVPAAPPSPRTAPKAVVKRRQT